MYKVAQQRHQTAKDRGRPVDWVNGTEIQSDEDRRRNLVRVVQSIDRQLEGVLDKKKRKELGRRKNELTQEISAIRPKRKAPNAAQHFIDAAREVLPRATFQLVMSRAAERSRADGELSA